MGAAGQQDPWESTVQASPRSERRLGGFWHRALQAINRRRASGQRTGHLLGEIPLHALLPSSPQRDTSNEASTAPCNWCTNTHPRLPQLCSAQHPKQGHRGTRGKSCWRFWCTVSVLERELVRQRRPSGAGLPWKQRLHENSSSTHSLYL